MSRPGTTLLLAAALLAGWPGAGADAYERVRTEAGAAARWTQRCIDWWMHKPPGGEVPMGKAMTVAERAFDTWASVDGTFLDFAGHGATCVDRVGPSSQGSAANVLVWREEPGAWPYSSRAVAVTTLTYDSDDGTIRDGDVELNGAGVDFATDGAPLAFDLQEVLTHEVGHLLGLAHSNVPEAVMYERSTPGRHGKRQLHDDDRAAARASHPVEATPDASPCPGDVRTHAPDAPHCPAGGGRGCAGGPAPLAPYLAGALALLALPGRRRRSVGLLAAVTALGLLAAPSPSALACTNYTSDPGIPLHWDRDDLGYTLDPEVPDELSREGVGEAFELGFGAWSGLDCHDLSIERRDWAACPGEDTQDEVNCVAWVQEQERWVHPTHLVAVTLVHFDHPTGHIFDVDMEVNGWDVDWSTEVAPACEANAHDLQASITHEAGHFVGLGHTEVEEATMHPRTERGDCRKRSLHDDDRTCFCDVYAERPGPGLDAGGDARRDAGGAHADTSADAGGGSGGGGRCAGGPLPTAPLAALALAALPPWRRRRRRR